MDQRANTLWKQRLKDYQDPGLDPEKDAEIRDYIAMRKAEVPDAQFF